MKINAGFTIDDKLSDAEYLYVRVEGSGVVCIKREGEGIVVDIFPQILSEETESLASVYVFDHEMVETDEDEEK